MYAKFICPIVLFSLIPSCICLEGKTAKLIVSYLEFKGAKFCFLFTCWSKQDQGELQGKLLKLMVRSSYLSVDENVLSNIHLKNYEKVSFILDLRCKNARKILVKSALTKKFIFHYSWLLISHENVDINQLFKNIKTRMDMDVKIATSRRNGYIIHEVFNPGLHSYLHSRKFGYFDGDNLTIYNDLTYYDSRKNMTGVLVRSANVVHYPYESSFHEYMTDLKLRKHDIYSKFHYQLFLTLQEIHGFHHNMTLRWSWFGNTSSGEDGGMSKLLYEETVDISSAGGIMRLIRSDRIDFYDYIMPYYKFRWPKLNIPNPGLVKPNFYEVLKPFATLTWYATLLTSLLVCLAIETANFVARRIGRTTQSWVSSLFITVAIFSQQGLAIVPEHLSGRIIFLNLLILSILLYNYYTSSLVSSLISTSPEVFTTIKELYESSLRVGMEPIPYTITYMLDTSKRDYYLKMLNATKIYEHGESPNFMSADEGIELVRRGGFAYHTEAITAYPLISKTFDQETLCDLAEISLLLGDTSLMTGKVSQYKKLFQISLRKMWQSGIMRKLYNTWVEGMPDCLSNARVISVSKNDLFLPYFILFVGVVASFIIFIFEMLWWRYQMKRSSSIVNTVANSRTVDEATVFTFAH